MECQGYERSAGADGEHFVTLPAVSTRGLMQGKNRSPPCAASVRIGSTAVTLSSSSWSLCCDGVLLLPGGSAASAGPASARSRLVLPDRAGPNTKHCIAHLSGTQFHLLPVCCHTLFKTNPAIPSWSKPVPQQMQELSKMPVAYSRRVLHRSVHLTWKTPRLAVSGFLSWRRGALMEKSAEGSPLYPSSSMCSRAAEG